MTVVREQPVLVPVDGDAPVYEGLRVGVPNAWNPEHTDYAEFGRISGTSIGVREAGSAQWVAKDLEQVAALKLEPGHLEPVWPGDDDERTDKAVRARISNQLRYSGSWPSLGWSLASDAWLSRVWDRHGVEPASGITSITAGGADPRAALRRRDRLHRGCSHYAEWRGRGTDRHRMRDRRPLRRVADPARAGAAPPPATLLTPASPTAPRDAPRIGLRPSPVGATSSGGSRWTRT